MHAICRLAANAALRVRDAGLFRIAVAITLLSALPATNARAEITQDQAVNFAVEAGVRALALTGVSIPPEAVHLLKDMVGCGAKGGSVGDCAKQAAVNVALQDAPAEVKQVAGCFVGGGNARTCVEQVGLAQVPPEARPVVQCLVDGGNVAGCAAKAAIGQVIAKVPPEVQPLVQCGLEGKSAAQCGAQAAAANLPAGSEAQKVAECVAGGGSAGDCAQRIGTQFVNAATTQAIGQAAEYIQKLKGEDDRLDPNSAAVNNIVQLARGIDQGRMDLIVLGGGPELAKIVLTAIITAIVPPAGLIAGPVIGALVDLYTTTGRVVLDKLMKLFKGEGEISDIGEILFQFYFQEMIARPCALIPSGGFKDAVCGGLADVIAAAAGVFGDAIDVVVKIVEGILKYTGVLAVLGWLGDAWDAVFGDGKEDPKVCGSPQEYFAKNHLPCLAAAVGSASPPNLAGACFKHFDRCHKNAGDMCGNLDKALADQAKQIYDALEQGARAYSPAVGAFIHGRRQQICRHGFEKNLESDAADIRMDFSTQCASALSTKRPLNPNTCGDGGNRNPTAAHRNACYTALGDDHLRQISGKTLQQHIAEVCNAYCAEDSKNCPPSFAPTPCMPGIPGMIEAFGFKYFPTREQKIVAMFNWCRIKPWSIYDRIDRVIRWPDKIDIFVDKRPDDPWMTFRPRQVVIATNTPKWAAAGLGAVVDRPLANLAVGSCKSNRTMLTPVAAWTSGGRTASLFREPPTNFSQLMQVSMAAPRPSALKLQLSVKSVALITDGFDSCTGMGALASRSSSGSDGSYSPRATTVTPGRGTTTVRSTPTTQPRGSSGFDTSRSGAMDRLTGDGQGGGVSSGYRLPDTSRGPMPGGAAASRGSSGASTSRPTTPQSSSGYDMVQPGGSPGTRSQGTSGASFTPGGGATGVFRNNTPRKIEIIKQQQPPPPPKSDIYLR